MAIGTMLKKLADARAKYEAALEQFGEKTQKELGELLGPLIPPGWALKWTQGTPSFNDGEPCTFSVHDPYLVKVTTVGDEDEEDEDVDQEDGDDWELTRVLSKWGKPDEEVEYFENDYSRRIAGTYEYEKIRKTYTSHGFPKIEGWTKAKIQELENAFRELDEDLMKRVFGDGAKVTITSDGNVEVDDYYCE
jgi:hypothetical protein